jgi:alkanesulfonate monooxygenase SsuD/methylene tetrahydromethanopterin reductase-like flavin-dependent oxidoreductase (luciferase family)
MSLPVTPLRLAVALDGAGWHPAARREPDARPADLFSAGYWADLAAEAERELVADRVDTHFVGSPARVGDQLEILRDVTGADELVITTITHDHAARVRSYQLLADEWHRR